MTQPAIFISHAVSDQPLAALLTAFLKEAIGVREADIFCSSVPGHGIPQGEDFNGYIKDQIQEPKLVILLMTPSYMESWFCLMELGAAWVKSAKTMAIVVPPVQFDAVGRTLGTKQAWNITDHVNLLGLKNLVKDQVTDLEDRSEFTWQQKREKWMLDLADVLKSLKGYRKVDASEHALVKSEIESKDAEIEALRNARSEDAELIAKLREAKDRTEVEQIVAGEADGDAEAQFELLMKAVRASAPDEASRVVATHIALDYFGKHLTIDWYNDKFEFTSAIEYNLISDGDHDYAVDWNRQKLKPFGRALGKLGAFLQSEEGSEWAEKQAEKGVPMEPDDKAFWEKHGIIGPRFSR